MNYNLQDAIWICLAVVFVYIMVYVVLFQLNIPDVWTSYSTGECVKVINYTEGDTYSCENMPSRYNNVWVK